MACNITLGIPLSRALTLELIQCFFYTVALGPYSLSVKNNNSLGAVKSDSQKDHTTLGKFK